MVTNCNKLKMVAADGRMRAADAVDVEITFRIIQSIPSPMHRSGGASRLKRFFYGFERRLSISVVNPYYVRNFAKSYRDLAKTDKIR